MHGAKSSPTCRLQRRADSEDLIEIYKTVSMLPSLILRGADGTLIVQLGSAEGWALDRALGAAADRQTPLLTIEQPMYLDV